MPLFHGAGIHLELVGALSLGASVVIASFNPSRFLDVLKEFKPTWFNLAPAMHGQILQHVSEEAIKEANLPLRFVRTGSAPMSEGMHAEIERIFGVPLVQVYGSTESHFMASTSKFVGSEPRHGSVGKTHPGVAIMSPSGDRLETSEVGEVWVRGEVVATEYYKDPEATAERFVDGWYRTGDSGYIDTEGYLFLTGRISDHISRGGENISPGEVEAVLESHELIAQAVGFSIPHPTLGQEVAAACVLTSGSALTSLEIRTFAAKGLSWSKVPKQIHIVDDLPLGATGKVSRKLLSEIYGADSDSAEPYSASG
jgi:acyl-CoA synthetase (AMP-forming)/AMP-acid ligase II